MEIRKYAVAGIVALLAIALGAAWLCLPSRWEVERSIVIDAAPEEIHRWLDSPRSWPAWLPWTTGEDPTFEARPHGPDQGPGAALETSGEHVGRGKMTIVQSDPARGVWYELAIAEVSEPAQGSITYESAPGGTRVTWRDQGDMGGNLAGRLFLPLLEASLARDFQRGLENLKARVESRG